MKTTKEIFSISFLRFLTLFFVVSIFISCGPSNNKASETSTEESVPDLLQEISSTPETVAPVSTELEIIEPPVDEIEVEETNSLVKLNPPHGEPGHSCDIAVGAPLVDTPEPLSEIQAPTNTPVPAPTTPTINSSGGRVGPTINNLQNFRPSPPVNSTNSTVSINPPHGQPGHSCDVAVGAPLPSTTANTTNVMLNPPHGQPNHRCDIAVGAPLPS